MIPKYLIITISAVALFSCKSDPTDVAVHKLELSEKTHMNKKTESSSNHSTYLPVYSSIHTISENEMRSLTSTVSIHNMNLNDSLFISKIDYYNTEGEYIRSYIEEPIFVKPMQTINIVVHQTDNTGGTGANFLIDWTLNNPYANMPLIEAVMLSTRGPQGISFTTKGELMN